ncbi:hypothetical protein N7G274_010843 [Stereocaulon virgatum]|uniref:Uncharacterized protein n=1 Tax=Stereocaulon virgatum TaxID=373712 RepID=A0ABR3ZSU0_9LECA
MVMNHRSCRYSDIINYLIVLAVVIVFIYVTAGLVFEEMRRVDNELRDQEEGNVTNEIQHRLLHRHAGTRYGAIEIEVTE